MLSVADRTTLRFGVNVTVIVQLPPGARPVPPIVHVWVCAKRPGFNPPSVMLEITSGTVPVFWSVTVCGWLVVLIETFPNASEVGDTVTAGRSVVPVRVTVPEVAGAATLTFTSAERFVLLLGLKVTLTVQLPPAARPVPPIGQLCVSPNRPGLAPPRPMLLILSAAPPIFRTVTA
jgi:hypothetical protein